MENRIKIIIVIFVTVLFWFRAFLVEWNKQKKRPYINVRDILCIIFSGSPVSVDIIICLP